jgi:small subunit ribosomal protein S2
MAILKPKGSKMIEVQIPEMMATGAHFGHQTKRWNPKMRPYLYGIRSGVHIIDLQQTKDFANNAMTFLSDCAAKGKEILFVGTKQQARDVVKEQAIRGKMHFVNHRWMGGTLTNFPTIKKSIDRLIEYTAKRENDDFKGYTKRELLDIDRKIIKLEASLGGIKRLKRYPDIVFVIDPKHEHIAVREANKLGIPVIAVVDSNCNPDPIDYIIPANDDAISSIEYFVAKAADACLEGAEKREEFIRMDEAKGGGKAAKPEKRRVNKGTSKAKDETDKAAYVSKAKNAEFEEKVESFSAAPEAEAVLEKKIIEDDGSETATKDGDAAKAS